MDRRQFIVGAMSGIVLAKLGCRIAVQQHDLARMIVDDWQSVKDQVIAMSDDARDCLIAPVCAEFSRIDPFDVRGYNIGRFARSLKWNASIVEKFIYVEGSRIEQAGGGAILC